MFHIRASFDDFVADMLSEFPLKYTLVPICDGYYQPVKEIYMRASASRVIYFYVRGWVVSNCQRLTAEHPFHCLQVARFIIAENTYIFLTNKLSVSTLVLIVF